MNSEFQSFLESHADLLRAGDFDGLYKAVYEQPTALVHAYTSELTKLLVEAEIDPLDYFKKEIPDYYAPDFPYLPSPHLIIPKGITSIGTNAFGGWKHLTSVDLNQVETISPGAFFGTDISDLNLPKSMSSCQAISSAFNRYKLRKITLEAGASIPTIRLYDCPVLEEVILLSPIEVSSSDNSSYKLTIVPGTTFNFKRGEWAQIKQITFKGTLQEWDDLVKNLPTFPKKGIPVICSDGNTTLQTPEEVTQAQFWSITTTPYKTFPDCINPARRAPFWKNSDAGGLTKGRLYWDSAEEAQKFIDENNFSGAKVSKSVKQLQELTAYNKIPGTYI